MYKRTLTYVLYGLSFISILATQSLAQCSSTPLEKQRLRAHSQYLGCQIRFDGATSKKPKYLLSKQACLSFCAQFDKNLKELNELKAPNPLLESYDKASMVPTYGWIQGKIDISEGFGAIDDLLSLKSVHLGPKNLDLGGGKFNHISAYLKLFGIDNFVFDPFGRSKAHNQNILNQAGSFDTVTSNSVLNVIHNPEERRVHITQAWSALKLGGVAYFKIYEGNGLGKASTAQTHLKTEAYANEIQAVFKKKLVKVLPHHFLIIAQK